LPPLPLSHSRRSVLSKTGTASSIALLINIRSSCLLWVFFASRGEKQMHCT
jgi:hypothetical protein